MSSARSVLVLCPDAPYPVTHGGRLAMWNEIRALVSAGTEVRVWYSSYDEPSAPERAVIAGTAAEAVWHRRPHPLRASLHRPFTPLQAARLLTWQEVDHLRGMAASSDVVIAQTDFMLGLAALVTQQRRVLLRTHGFEPEYFAALADASSGLRQLYYSIEHRRVRRFVARHLTTPGRIVAMTEGDADFLRAANQGAVPVAVVPPAVIEETELSEFSEQIARDRWNRRTILFVGRLDLPHTASGLMRFTAESWAGLRPLVPGLRFVVVSHRVPLGVKRELIGAGAEVFSNVDELDPVYEAATVFVNPVWTGSGLNMKIGPPLARGLPVITTPFGARGYEPGEAYPPGLLATEDFTSSIVSLLRSLDHYRAASLAASKYADATLRPSQIAARLALEIDAVASA